MMAANWVFADTGVGRFFREAEYIAERDMVIHRIVNELSCSRTEAEELLTDKEVLIAPLLPTLETAYLRINGKHLLFHVHKKYIQRELKRENLSKYLARTVKEKIGIPEDIKTIVERRILG
jgi:hypothetical protein